MTQERPIIELLKVVLENMEQFESGLCVTIFKLDSKRIINFFEFIKLTDYIHYNRPSKFSSFDAFKNRNKPHYWTKGNKEHRIKWLSKQIKLLENDKQH